jgi:hypothetical protein
MTKPQVTNELIGSPRSVDMVRVIRRSMRCFLFGVVGLVPLIGAGFAYQALRLRRSLSADLEDGWTPPPVIVFWLMGIAAMLVARSWLGLAGDLAICVAILGLQSWLCWRSFQNRHEKVWNPGGRQLFLGVLSAYAGLGVSLWIVVVLVLQVLQVLDPV